MNFFGLLYINDWLLIIGGLVYALHKYTSWYYNWWSSQGVPGPKPLPFALPLWSSIKEGVMMDSKLMNKYGDTVGIFEGRQPALMTQDDDMLREVLVKQFHNFANRRRFDFPEGTNMEYGLFSRREEHGWKETRELLSPAFSSGKLRRMTKQVNDCALYAVKSIGDLPSSGKVFNLKEIMADMTMNFIATVAFGLDLKDTNSIKEFSEKGRELNEQFTSAWRLIMLVFFPDLSSFLQKYMKINILDISSLMFFKKVVDTVLSTRTKGDSSRLDFVQLMANAHNETVDKETIEEVKHLGEQINTSRRNNKRLTKEEILGNGVLFFNAGFDTVSTSLSFLFYELALHPEHQEKVYEEVAELFAKKKELAFDDAQELTYLDCCYSECLRLHPVVPRLDRSAKNEIRIKDVTIKQGMVVNIPVLSIHLDPRRWPEPEKFLPERFTEEEKKNRSPFSWMPFGYGPRHCIGMRLALMEAKLAAAHIIHNFRFEPCSTTQVPFIPSPFGVVTGKGLDINILPRNKSS